MSVSATEHNGRSHMLHPAMTQKLRAWRDRYLLAELYSLMATMIVAVLAFEATASNLVMALAATVAGSCTYFAYILGKDIRLSRQRLRACGKSYCLQTFIRNVNALLVEFGAAEVIDLFIIRPALMYYLPLWMDSLTYGTLVAKLLADLTFYIPVVVSYELSKRWLRESS